MIGFCARPPSLLNTLFVIKKKKIELLKPIYNYFLYLIYPIYCSNIYYLYTVNLFIINTQNTLSFKL